MRKYTILHTIETAGPGGAETVLLNVARGLDPARFNSVVLLPGSGWLKDQLTQANVPTWTVESKAWYDLRLLRTLIGLARRTRADLIHAHLPDQNFYACLAGRLARRKVVVTYHGTQQLSNDQSAKTAIKLRVVRNTAATAVIVSDHLARLLQAARFPADRIARIHNGIDCGRFMAPATGRFRAALGWHNGTKLVGTVANLRDGKGYTYFVRAARLIADAMPKVQFVAVGATDNGSHGDLLKLVSELRLQERVHFLGFRPDVPEILADLDVFLLSSVSEGFSLATVEAMAAGKPVVVTRSGGPEEIVENGKTGFLVPAADPAALAMRVCEILKDQELASTLGRQAQKAAQETFSLQKMISEYETVYDRCLGVRPQ